ncbi:MAG TPA: zinc-binding alcohol dehydrogenase [Anaerolineales bacterium]|nr:zinc-binding alcohol dehydrogenase [Anaerolineales bacterium]
MKRRTLYFTAPRQVELREESLPALGADEVLVETICSAISAGTEMLVYQNRFPRDTSTALSAGLETDSVISSLRGGFEYPLAYGYATVGVVRETGTHVDKSLRDKLVFAFQPHTSHFIAQPNSLFPIPDSLSPESACFLPNTETAVNLVQDGAPILGERVLIFGQGVVGLLTASLLDQFPLECLATADCHELRRAAFNVQHSTFSAQRFLSLDPNAPDFRSRLSGCAQEGFDLIYELSGNPAALSDAIALTRFSGRVVVGSWYGEKRAPIDLGGTFHRSRIKLLSSQVSTIAPELSARWDKSRRFKVAWEALKRIQPEKWITHRFPLEQAAEAYHLLDEHPQETIQVVIDYNNVL